MLALCSLLATHKSNSPKREPPGARPPTVPGGFFRSSPHTNSQTNVFAELLITLYKSLMQPKTLIGAGVFAIVLITLSYLLIAAESLSKREIALLERIEVDVAKQLGEPTLELFPLATRITNKVHIGGSNPFIYKLTGTNGRPGKRVDIGFSVLRTEDKARRRFDTRWKHELRANSQGKLKEIELNAALGHRAHLAQLHGSNGEVIGMFFLAQTQRGIFSLALKGIVLEGSDAFAAMMAPTLTFLETHGHTLMLDEPS